MNFVMNFVGPLLVFLVFVLLAVGPKHTVSMLVHGQK